MNDSQNYARFKPCLDLIISQHPSPTKFTTLGSFTPNSYCTLLRRAKHYHVQVLSLPFPDGVTFRFGHDHVIVGLPKSSLEPVLPTGGGDTIKLTRPISKAEFSYLCALIDGGIFSHTFYIPGSPPAALAPHLVNVELVQNSDHFLLL